VMIEETVFFRFFDLGMGLQQGFDAFTDAPLRSGHPLLGREVWAAELERAGFGAALLAARQGSPSHTLGLDVMLARLAPAVARIDRSSLSAFLAERLPEYMVPADYVVIDAVPLSASGKVDRSALPALRSAVVTDSHPFVAPRNDLEETICALWREVLEVERVGVTDDFFRLGGDSLLASQLAASLRQRLGIHVPLKAVFEAPTVEDMAGLVAIIREHASEEPFEELRLSGTI
jgi:pyochelin synthetase